MKKIIHTSEIPFHITKKIAYLTISVFFVFDIFFVIAYLISTLPEIRNEHELT